MIDEEKIIALELKINGIERRILKEKASRADLIRYKLTNTGEFRLLNEQIKLLERQRDILRRKLFKMIRGGEK